MNEKRKFLLMIIAILTMATANVFAQETTGGIEGTITDPTGAVVPNAEVTISGASDKQNASVGFSRKVQSDENGFFRVLQVPPGTYKVSVAELNGFSPTTLENVSVVLGKTTALSVALTVGSQNVSIDVNADDSAVIDPTDNKIQTNITDKVADLLPRGTNFTSLLQVAPAVKNEPLSGGFQIDGASGSENTFIVDGQEVTNFRTGILNQNNNLPFQLSSLETKFSSVLVISNRCMKKQHLKLTEADERYLTEHFSRGQVQARILRRATALLQLNQGMTIRAVADTLKVGHWTVSIWRNKYLTNGLDFLCDRPRAGRPVEIDGEQRAKITAPACSDTPAGRAKWSLRLLADKIVELGFCEEISHTQVGKILKKTNSSRI